MSARASSSRSSPSPATASPAGFDIVVIGAGVIGLAIGARLSAAGHSVLILERATAIAQGITSRNSEVIHAGIYYPADSLKARFCVEGRSQLYAWCAERRVEHRRLGKWILATRPEEEGVLEDLFAQGRANGVDNLGWIEGERISSLEPGVVARRALDSPDSGIVDGHGLCQSLLAEAESHSAVLALGREVVALESRSFGWSIEVRTGDGSVESIDAGVVVGAAGLDADRVAEWAGLPVDELGWRQHLCKGDYFTLALGGSCAAPTRLLYPVPQAAGLGIHVTLDLAGRMRFGPDTEYVSEVGFAVDPAKAIRFREAVARYFPALGGVELVPDYSGIRPKRSAEGEGFRDFVVEETSQRSVPGFVACLGIESPGLTSALALADHVGRLISV